jgi:curved DNA-binding protein CbpA
MVNEPHAVLGLSADADDEAIRRRYLELVRQFPPEQNPEKFGEVRAAYEALKDVHTRLHRRLFERGTHESLEALIGGVACRSSRRRLTLEALLQAVVTGR